MNRRVFEREVDLCGSRSLHPRYVAMFNRQFFTLQVALFCIYRLSGTCQHVVGLLLTAASAASLQPTCTDLPCAWIVPPGAKKLEPSKPLKDITFKVASPNATNATKRKRSYDPCPQALPGDLDTFRRNLQNASPRALWLRYDKV